MSKNDDVALAALRELVDALDRRAPHVERLGETDIARDAEALREKAVHRIHELSRVQSERDQETERSGGVMTDDGGPLRTGE